MKQKEQQRAIVEFREGVHNVLVCTSIGEEGLDIGQVDLIINFDCLSSPIRMIQRTGRTGRKRDGKVVCLVTKGEEEKKLDKSGSATKMLRRALKESSHFPLAKNIPLTPFYPRMEKKAMEINSSYHLSQIGGHNRIRKPKKTNKNWQHDSTWKLSVADNEDCNNLFGFPTFSEFSVKKSITSWQSRLIQSRNHKAQIPENCLGKGRSCSLLRRIEFLHCSENGNDLTTKLYHHLTPSLKDLEANDARSESCSKHEDNDAMNLDANDACSESSSKYEYNDAIIFESDCDESSIISNNIQPREEINYNTQENKIACQSSPTSRHDLNRIFGPNESWNFEQKESERKIQEIIFGNAEVLRPVTPPLENIRHEQLIESTQNEAEAKSCKSHFELPKENISQDEKWLAFDCVEDNRTVGSKKNTESSVLIFDEKKDTRKDKDETQNHIVPTYGDDEVRCEFVLPTQFDDSSSSSSEDKRENIKMNAPKDDADNEIQNSEVSKHGDEKVRCEIVLPSQFDDSSTSSEDEGGTANLQGPEKPKSSQNIDHSLETDGRLQLPGEKISTSYDNCSSNIKPQNTPRIFLSESVQNDTKTMKKDEEENVVVHQHLNDTTYSKDAIPIRNEINEKYTPEDSLKNINTKDIQQGDADKLKPIVQEEDEIISFCFDIPTQSSSSSSDGSSDKDSDSGRSALDRTDVRNSDACNILHAPESLRQSQREQVLGDDLTPIVHKRRKLSIHKKKSLKKIIFSQVMSTPHTSVGECDLTDTPQKSVGPSEILSQTGALVDTPLQSKRDRSTSERRVFQNKKKQAKIHENASTRRKYRQSQCNLLDIEANAASDDEATYSEDEECNFKNQSQDSFINDTSQLGYTQDALDLVENNVDSTQRGIKGQTLDDKAIHRVVDNKWNQTDMFSTPILRRRKRIKADGSTQISQLSMPSSDRGLGKMHFIRSVLEHHKAGGDDEEIEKEYHSILKDKVGLPTQTTNVLHGKESVGTVTNLSNVGNRQSSTLSEEQKLRIRENRRLALIRRAAHQKEKCKFSNDSF
jgi:superfamily II DNA/RNA helicase